MFMTACCLCVATLSMAVRYDKQAASVSDSDRRRTRGCPQRLAEH
jgi:hypothetical protein